MTSECEAVLLSAMAVADGEQSVLPQSDVEVHMAGCAACREELDEFKGTVELLVGRQRAQGRLQPVERRQTTRSDTLWAKTSAGSTNDTVSLVSLLAAAVLMALTGSLFYVLPLAPRNHSRERVVGTDATPAVIRVLGEEGNAAPTPKPAEPQPEVLVKGKDPHALIALLGADDFALREEAMSALKAHGHGLHAVLRLAYAESTDPEVRRRLLALLTPEEDERYVRILYVTGEQDRSFEFRYFKNFLLRGERIHAEVYLSDKKEFTREGSSMGKEMSAFFPRNKAEFDVFDVIVLGEMDPSAFGEDRSKCMQDFVREGGGMVFFAGQRFVPEALVNHPLGEALPVVPYSPEEGGRPLKLFGNADQMFYAQPTQDAENNLWLSLDPLRNIADEWKHAASFYGYVPVKSAKESACVLLEHPMVHYHDGKALPLLVSMPYGAGSSIFIGVQCLWRLRRDPQKGYYDRFMRQMLYYAGRHSISARHERRKPFKQEVSAPEKQLMIEAQKMAEPQHDVPERQTSVPPVPAPLEREDMEVE